MNYRELVRLQAKYGSGGFTVLAFPCNQFGQQEPGSEQDIVRFVREAYGVTFPLFSKVDVRGEQTCAVPLQLEVLRLPKTLLPVPVWVEELLPPS